MNTHTRITLACLSILVVSAALAAQDAQKPAPSPAPAVLAAPSLDTLAKEIAVIQRDLLILDQETKANIENYQKSQDKRRDDLRAKLQESMTSAGKLCPAGEVYDGIKLKCEKPQAQPQAGPQAAK